MMRKCEYSSLKYRTCEYEVEHALSRYKEVFQLVKILLFVYCAQEVRVHKYRHYRKRALKQLGSYSFDRNSGGGGGRGLVCLYF